MFDIFCLLFTLVDAMARCRYARDEQHEKGASSRFAAAVLFAEMFVCRLRAAPSSAAAVYAERRQRCYGCFIAASYMFGAATRRRAARALRCRHIDV